MMNSSFYPVSEGNHSLKITSSSQEWCGHTYMELKNKKQFDVSINSYFEGESKQITLKKNILEDDIMSMIRTRPEELPLGEHKVIPSFFSLRLLHKEIKAYECIMNISNNGSHNVYELHYPALERTMEITFDSEFPHKILGWKETQNSGFGNKRKKMTTTAKIKKTLKSTYWQKNSNADEKLRSLLELE